LPGRTREYRLRLPAGEYRRFRIDPGTLAGRYTIDRIAILSRDGSLHAAIPLTALVPAHQVTIVEASEARLVAEAPAGQHDPQFLYSPPRPIVVPGALLSLRTLGTAFFLTLAWLAGIGLVWIVEQIVRRFRGTLEATFRRRLGGGGPDRTLTVVAMAVTLLATYPVAFLGRSLVAPTNGYLRLLYDGPPFSPGAEDTFIEDTRGSDTAATVYAFVPYSLMQRDALSNGELPLWNRYNGTGRPLWGQGQTFLFDPLHWLTLVVPDVTLGWDLKLIAHRFVFALGIGIAAFLVTGEVVSAAIVATASAFVSVYLYRLNHPAAFALTYAPWALAGWFHLARASHRVEVGRAVVWIAVATSLLLVSSPPKEGTITLLGLIGAGAAVVLLACPTWRLRVARLLAAGVAGVVFLLLTAPHWLLFLDTLKLSMTSYDNPYAIIAGRPHALGLFLTPFTPGVTRTGVNALVLVLLIAATTAPLRLLRSPPIVACAIAAGALLAVAFGAVPNAWLFRIPLVGNIGHIDDVFITAAVPPLLIAAAGGASVLLTASRARAVLVSLLTAIVSALLLILVAKLTLPGGFEPFAAALVLLSAVILPLCLAGLASTGEWLPKAAGIAVVIAVVLPVGVHLPTGIALLDPLLLQPRPRTPLDATSPALDAVRAASSEPSRILGLDWWLFSGSQALYRLEGIGGPDALETPAYEQLVDAAGITRRWLWLTTLPANDLAKLSPLLDLLNVRFLVSGRDEAPPGFADMRIMPPDKARVGLRETAWPRAFFVDGIVTYREVQDFIRHLAGSRGPFAAVQASDSDAVAATRTMSRPAGTVVRGHGYRLSINTTTFTVAAPRAGIAVLTETFLPGEFRATLNGAPVSYFRVNHAFKAVAIPSAGEWTVSFEHRPARGEVSLALAGVGAVLLVGVMIVSRSSWARAVRAERAVVE
jgi:hypothetical protein